MRFPAIFQACNEVSWSVGREQVYPGHQQDTWNERRSRQGLGALWPTEVSLVLAELNTLYVTQVYQQNSYRARRCHRQGSAGFG